jgi:hypothetical protein
VGYYILAIFIGSMVCYLFGFFGLMKFVYLLHNVHADCDNSCFEIAMDPVSFMDASLYVNSCVESLWDVVIPV